MTKVSLFSIMLVCGATMSVDAKVTVRKSGTYADAYKQVVDMRQQAQMQTAQQITTAADLPVVVEDEVLAQEIIDNTSDTVTAETLEQCSMIYPRGNFKWAVPESGDLRNSSPRCVAVIDLYDADSQEVLATTTLAAGDIMKCNIDMFPQSGYQAALARVTLPADAAPTEADVVKVMNEEQKQNAGFKIAAAAILSGVAGNMLAPKAAGDNKLMGTNNRQLVDSAIGAAAGAGVMAASVYSGKVAGDTIKSTAINAASGAVVGNMVAGQQGSNSTLDIKRCKLPDINSEKDCVPGNIFKESSESSYEYAQGADFIYLVNNGRNIYRCDKQNGCGTDDKDCNLRTTSGNYYCTVISSNGLLDIKLSGDLSAEDVLFQNSEKNETSRLFGREYYQYDPDTQKFANSGTYGNNNTTGSPNFYFIVQKALKPSGSQPVYAVFDSKIPTKLMGYKVSDWESELSAGGYTYYFRNPDGTVGQAVQTTDEQTKTAISYRFVPTSLSATDGALIDFSNAARRKSTLTGAAAGGALGGFSAYQGAKSEIEERWVTAKREYDDSLLKFGCKTGTRPLSSYNEDVFIPNMKDSAQ